MQSNDAPDKDCYTLPNGECVAENCSLHGPLRQPPEMDWEKERSAMGFIESLIGIYCIIHDTFELAQVGSIICPECWHVYYTQDDVVKDYNESFEREIGHPSYKEYDQISFCPHCLHDF